MSLVRVQSEEPYLRSLLRKLSRLFAFCFLLFAFCFLLLLIAHIKAPAQSGQHFIYNDRRYLFQALAVPSFHINSSGLITANNARRFSARIIQLNANTSSMSKVSATGDRN
ncbi:hypothetical protein RZ575_000329 [Citrobacter freundii]|nr:hypothetical protein [Citrobacter freundii]ELN3964667.1 hypothetical protein [Citrobacter freundii]MBJ8693186.1 hypothetical protein [Citrobacter freundii]HED1227614.1 hypothetical protein [Citrobacter freundii]